MSENGITGATGEMSMGTPRPGCNNFQLGRAVSISWKFMSHHSLSSRQWESQDTFIRPEEKAAGAISTAAIDESGD